MVQVVNVVAGGELGREFALQELATDLSKYTYDISRHEHVLYIKIEDDLPLIMLYRTGKYVITGAESVSAAASAKKLLIKMLSEMGIDDIESSFEIYNIVCTGDLQYDIDLEAASLNLGLENTEYEPEQSPFLIYRLENHDCVITIASSGRCVINGITSIDQAREAFGQLNSQLDASQN